MAEPHDQRSKVLLHEFLPEFLAAFFGAVHAQLDFANVEWLVQELFLKPPEGEKRIVDVVAKVNDRQGRANLLHVESWSADGFGDFENDVLVYHESLLRTRQLPVLTIALFLRMHLEGIDSRTVRRSALGLETTTFTYQYVALGGLRSADYLDGNNPLAVTLASLMRIDRGERARTKASILRRLIELKVPPFRMEMLTECVEAYLVLNEAEQAEYDSLTRTEEYKMVEPLPHPWVERGRAEERVETTRQHIFMLGTSRCKEPDEATRQLIESTTNAALLGRWFEQALRADSWAEVVAEPPASEPATDARRQDADSR